MKYFIVALVFVALGPLTVHASTPALCAARLKALIENVRPVLPTVKDLRWKEMGEPNDPDEFRHLIEFSFVLQSGQRKRAGSIAFDIKRDRLDLWIDVDKPYRGLGLYHFAAALVLSQNPEVKVWKSDLGQLNAIVFMNAFSLELAGQYLIDRSASDYLDRRSTLSLYSLFFDELHQELRVAADGLRIRRRILEAYEQTPEARVQRKLGFNKLKSVSIALSSKDYDEHSSYIDSISELGEPTIGEEPMVFIRRSVALPGSPESLGELEYLPDGRIVRNF